MNIAVFEHEIIKRLGGGYRYSDGYQYRYYNQTKAIVLIDSNQVSIDLLLLIFPFLEEKEQEYEDYSDFVSDKDECRYSKKWTEELLTVINKEIHKNTGYNLPLDFCMQYFRELFVSGNCIDLHNPHYINVEVMYKDVYTSFILQQQAIRLELDALYYIKLLNSPEFYFNLNQKTSFFDGLFPLDFAYNKNSIELIKILLFKGATKCENYSFVYKVIYSQDQELKRTLSENIIKNDSRLAISCLRRAIIANDLYLTSLLVPKIKRIDSIYYHNDKLTHPTIEEDGYKGIDRIIEISEQDLEKDFFYYNEMGMDKKYVLHKGIVFTFISLAYITKNDEFINLLASYGANKEKKIAGYFYKELVNLK